MLERAHHVLRTRTGRILAVYLAMRAAAFAAMLAAAGPHARTRFGSPFEFADSGWFVNTALHGYPSAPAEGFWRQCTVAFFPGYPATIAALHAVGVPAVAAATLLTVTFGALAALVLARLTDAVTGQPGGTPGLVAAALLSCFPGSVVLNWGYSEGLAAVCAAGCLLALTRRRWWLAGLAAALASSVRADMLALTVACLAAAALAVARQRDWRSLVAPALAPLGTLGYFTYLWAHTGSFTVWFTVERNGWGQNTGLAAPLLTFDTTLQRLLTGDRTAVTILAGCVAVPFIGLLLWRARPPLPLLAYTFALLAIECSTTVVGPRPRALLLVLPMFCAAGKLVGRRSAIVVCALSAVATVVVMAMHMLSNSPVPP